MHVGLSKSIATRKRKNRIQGSLNKKIWKTTNEWWILMESHKRRALLNRGPSTILKCVYNLKMSSYIYIASETFSLIRHGISQSPYVNTTSSLCSTWFWDQIDKHLLWGKQTPTLGCGFDSNTICNDLIPMV